MRGARLDAVRRAVRDAVERTPELRRDPALRRRVAENMVRVCATAAELVDVDGEMTERVGRRAGTHAAPLAAAQAAGDFHRQTATGSAAGVLRDVRNAIDFPGFVTSLITGVFQAMSTSTIQQLQAYADLLGAVGMSTGQFAATSITSGRAMDWAAQRFPALRVAAAGGAPRLELGEGAEMPDAEELRSALEATDEEVSTIDEDELEETLLPLVKRKLARDRQAMLSTMLLMGMNRIVVDEGRIHASMNLQVDARSTAEQNTAERFDSRVTTGASASFGAGMWGASANLQASVGYVTSDEQHSREDIAVRAGLRSSVDVAFHTEPIQLERMAGESAVRRIRDRSMVPAAEHNLENLLPAGERRTRPASFAEVPAMPAPPPDPASDEARALRARRNLSPPAGESGGTGAAPAAGSAPAPASGAAPAPTPAPASGPAPAAAPAPAAGSPSPAAGGEPGHAGE